MRDSAGVNAGTVTDELLERTAALGDDHEQRRLDQLRDEHGGDVAVIGRPFPFAVENVTAGPRRPPGERIDRGAPRSSIRPRCSTAASSGSPTSWSAAKGGTRSRTPSWPVRRKSPRCFRSPPTPIRWPTRGSQWHPDAELVLGNGVVGQLPALTSWSRCTANSACDCSACSTSTTAHGSPVRWDDEQVRACFRCPVCEEQVRATDDLLLVAGMRVSQRATLLDAGISTVAELAEGAGPVANVSARSLQSTGRAGQSADPRTRHRRAAVRGCRPAAADPVARPGQRRHVLRLRGRSAVAGRRRRLGAGIPVRRSRRRQERDTCHPFWAHDRPAERKALRISSPCLAKRRTRTPTCTSTTTPPTRGRPCCAWPDGTASAKTASTTSDEWVLVDLYPLCAEHRTGSEYSASRRSSRSTWVRTSRRARSPAPMTRSSNTHSTADYAATARSPRQRLLEDIEAYNGYDCRSTRGYAIGVAPGRRTQRHPGRALTGLPMVAASEDADALGAN